MRIGVTSRKRWLPRAAMGVTAGLVGAVVASAAQAQSASCSDIQPMLLQRKSIADSLNTGKKQIDAKFACSRFGALVQNGAKLIKWTEANKDWCSVPDSFVAGIKQDHQKAVGIQAKACGIAAKQAQMEKQAKQGGGGGGLLGGNGLSGDMRMPQGAL